MGPAVRFYLFSDNGLQRISHRLMDGLARGKDAMPQYAGTKQKIANVIVEMENGKPVQLGRTDGLFLTFDEAGQVHKDLIASGMAAMETYRALERADQTPTGTVIDLSPKLNREKWARENRWTPSKEDLDAICDDIWKRKKAAALKVVQAKGILPKPPTLSYEAKEAIREIEKQVWGISGKLEWLSDVTLKTVAFEARELAKVDGANAIWLGVADAANRRREILSLYRSGKGVWHATVGVLGGYENFNFTEQDINGRLTGDGWTVGSYLGWNIAPTLRYDAAMAYSGIAYNGTAGTAQGNFNGERWMVSTGLTGTYKAWGLTIEPSAKVYALWENEGSYVDSLGTQQANHDFSTGRASGGVKLIYPFAWSDGITLAPYAGIYGDYYFDQDDATAIVAAGGVPLASTPLLEGWSARIVAGLGAKLANGAMLAFGTEYGGIGSDFQTWTLKGRGQLPFDAK
jgi:Autotransporter beta-domain